MNRDENNVEFVKELGGTILVILNGFTYEMSRGKNSNIIDIDPDKDSPKPTREQSELLIKLFKDSSCYLR